MSHYHLSDTRETVSNELYFWLCCSAVSEDATNVNKMQKINVLILQCNFYSTYTKNILPRE